MTETRTEITLRGNDTSLTIQPSPEGQFREPRIALVFQERAEVDYDYRVHLTYAEAEAVAARLLQLARGRATTDEPSAQLPSIQGLTRLSRGDQPDPHHLSRGVQPDPDQPRQMTSEEATLLQVFDVRVPPASRSTRMTAHAVCGALGLKSTDLTTISNVVSALSRHFEAEVVKGQHVYKLPKMDYRRRDRVSDMMRALYNWQETEMPQPAKPWDAKQLRDDFRHSAWLTQLVPDICAHHSSQVINKTMRNLIAEVPRLGLPFEIVTVFRQNRYLYQISKLGTAHS